MKYICLKNCIINKTPVMADTVLDIDDEQAKMLLGIGRIAPYDEEPLFDNRSVGITNSPETLVKRRGRPKKYDG
jgi:hypothetical protein